MEDPRYVLYEVKLNRFMNIQTKDNLTWALISAFVFIVHTVVNLVVGEFSTVQTLFVGAGCLIVMSVKLLSYPKRLYVTSRTVRFQYNILLLNLVTRGRVGFDEGSASRYDKDYTLYNIKSIEYFQTKFDKLFSCGHVRICGYINSDEGKKEERTFTIYGVKDFENTAEWMKEHITVSAESADSENLHKADEI